MNWAYPPRVTNLKVLRPLLNEIKIIGNELFFTDTETLTTSTFETTFRREYDHRISTDFVPSPRRS